MGSGIQFPVGPSGKVSTSYVGQLILSRSIKNLDPDLSRDIQQEKQWRRQYHKYMPAYQAVCSGSVNISEAVAEQSLEDCHDLFRFHRDGCDMPLKQAMKMFDQFHFYDGKIVGSKTFDGSVRVKYGKDYISREGLQYLLKNWTQKGIIELSHGNDVNHVVNELELLDLRGKTFVILGATSEVGPLKMLLQLGATVVAISRPNSKKWQDLIQTARNSCGTLIFPIDKSPSELTDEQLAMSAGADLLTQTPELAYWLNQIPREFTLGCYAYLDGSKHVRVVMAMDAITQYLLEKRNDVSLAYLLTPSDIYSVPSTICDANKKKAKGLTLSSMSSRLLNLLTLGNWFVPNIVKTIDTKEQGSVGILDNLVNQQGPNYVLAKRIQRWRAMDSAKKGVVVSCNVAPASSTRSVMSNPFFQAASAGSESFGVEVFSPEMVNVLMTLQLIQDIRVHEQSNIRGEGLFIRGANHGGAWRIGYQFRSLLVLSLTVGLLQKLVPVNKLFNKKRLPQSFRLTPSS